MRPALGIDLGGTKIEAVVLAADGQAFWRRRIATPQGHYDGCIAAMAGLVDEARRQSADLSAASAPPAA